MADKTDKALTQEPRTELNIPGQEELQESLEQDIAVEQSKKGPVEIQEEEDGSVTVDLILTQHHQKVVMNTTQT